jgi:hypothetical protein
VERRAGEVRRGALLKLPPSAASEEPRRSTAASRRKGGGDEEKNNMTGVREREDYWGRNRYMCGKNLGRNRCVSTALTASFFTLQPQDEGLKITHLFFCWPPIKMLESTKLYTRKKQ